jgi:23S rRNA pseudouridine2605 synthase
MKTSRGPKRVSLPRALSKLGFSSRAQALALIAEGRVTVNATVETNPHRWLDLRRDRVQVDGEAMRRPATRWLAFHKPAGVVTTRKSERNDRTIYDVLGNAGEGLIPVGRLDKETSGLLLLTTDTILADAVTRPETGLEKVYRLTLDRPIAFYDRRKLETGIAIRVEGTLYRTKPATVHAVRGNEIEIGITEGKNRQLRRMMEALGYEILALHRTSVGPIRLGQLKRGEVRALRPGEVAQLRRACRTRV